MTNTAALVMGNHTEPLTVFRDLQDVADQGAVAIKGLGPCEVDGPLLCGAQNCYWIFWSMGQLPVHIFVCVCDGGRDKVIKRNRIRQERQKITELNSQTESLALYIRGFDGLERRAVIKPQRWRKHPSIMSCSDVNKTAKKKKRHGKDRGGK